MLFYPPLRVSAGGNSPEILAREVLAETQRCSYNGVMARPKVHHEARVTTAVRFPESLHGRLRTAADERELSANYLIVRAVEDYLDHLIPADEFTLTKR